MRFGDAQGGLEVYSEVWGCSRRCPGRFGNAQGSLRVSSEVSGCPVRFGGVQGDVQGDLGMPREVWRVQRGLGVPREVCGCPERFGGVQGGLESPARFGGAQGSAQRCLGMPREFPAVALGSLDWTMLIQHRRPRNSSPPSITPLFFPLYPRMLHQKGGTDPEPCQHSSDCGHQDWTWPHSADHCHDPGSLSHDLEGSCQSPPQPCPAQPSSCKPRRRVEVSPVPPVCPPPVKIHRRPLEQHRPCPRCPEPDCCGKPRRRVEQSPEEDEEPPVVLQPLRHRCPCSQRCPRAVPCCPRAVPCYPRAVPLPPHPCHQQQQQQKITLVPLCVKN